MVCTYAISDRFAYPTICGSFATNSSVKYCRFESSELVFNPVRGCFKGIKALYTRPPTPQFWGTFEPILLQSPPELGDLGGGSGHNLYF
jgi:hypothetical protein